MVGWTCSAGGNPSSPFNSNIFRFCSIILYCCSSICCFTCYTCDSICIFTCSISSFTCSYCCCYWAICFCCSICCCCCAIAICCACVTVAFCGDNPIWTSWFSHKFKGPGVQYEVGLGIQSGDIIRLNGPFPCGKWSDIKKNQEWDEEEAFEGGMCGGRWQLCWGTQVHWSPISRWWIMLLEENKTKGTFMPWDSEFLVQAMGDSAE